jgi:hypothetical protein
MIKAHLGADFECPAGLLMFQLGLLVFVRRSASLRVDEIETRCEGTGLLGIAPNKGACVCRLRVTREGAGAGAGAGEGARLVFLSAHLAAHMKHADARNAQAAQAINNARLGPNTFLDLDVQHDHCFVFGDLNYRIDLGIARAGPRDVDNEARFREVHALITAAAADPTGPARAELLAADQLRSAMRHGAAFAGFSEAAGTEPPFAPTFKVERRAGLNFQSSRVSSWCDRVLTKSLPALRGDLRCVEYASHPSLATSDHKPVSAAFELSLRAPRAGALDRATPVNYLEAPVVRLRGLAGRGLLGFDQAGLSDPFVTVLCDRGESSLRGAGKSLGPPRTRVAPQTVAPSWPDTLEFKIAARSPEDLESSHLFLVVLDADIVEVRSERMGQAVLPLAAAARAGGAEVAFDVAVTRGAVASGFLSGTLQVQWPPASREPILLAHDQFAESRGEDCCVA